MTKVELIKTMFISDSSIGGHVNRVPPLGIFSNDREAILAALSTSQRTRLCAISFLGPDICIGEPFIFESE
jgi:hypothetical protein